MEWERKPKVRAPKAPPNVSEKGPRSALGALLSDFFPLEVALLPPILDASLSTCVTQVLVVWASYLFTLPTTEKRCWQAMHGLLHCNTESPGVYEYVLSGNSKSISQVVTPQLI